MQNTPTKQVGSESHKESCIKIKTYKEKNRKEEAGARNQRCKEMGSDEYDSLKVRVINPRISVRYNYMQPTSST